MEKIKYFFNTHTLRFEKIEVPLKVRLLQTIGFILASIAVGVLFVAILFQYIDSPKEQLLRQQNTAYKESYAVLQERMKQLELQMVELEVVRVRMVLLLDTTHQDFNQILQQFQLDTLLDTVHKFQIA